MAQSRFALCFFPKVLWFHCGSTVVCSFWKLGHRPAHVDLFGQQSSNTHSQSQDLCSYTTHAQSHLMLRTRMAAKRKCSGTIKKCLAVEVLMLQSNWTLIFVSGTNCESGFNRV